MIIDDWSYVGEPSPLVVPYPIAAKVRAQRIIIWTAVSLTVISALATAVWAPDLRPFVTRYALGLLGFSAFAAYVLIPLWARHSALAAFLLNNADLHIDAECLQATAVALRIISRCPIDFRNVAILLAISMRSTNATQTACVGVTTTDVRLLYDYIRTVRLGPHREDAHSSAQLVGESS